jgi:hypothetical protein
MAQARSDFVDRGDAQYRSGAGFLRLLSARQWVSGAALIDDISFRKVGGDNSAFLSQFDVSAFVKGAVNIGAGETLGNVQIRLEDSDGDRLALTTSAGATFQSIGGTLDTFTDQNVDGIDSNGAFNPASDSLRVVVAFDNDPANTWGTGGTLTVDDLLVSNTFSSTADDYVAALIWEGIPSLGVDSLRQALPKSPTLPAAFRAVAISFAWKGSARSASWMRTLLQLRPMPNACLPDPTQAVGDSPIGMMSLPSSLPFSVSAAAEAWLRKPAVFGHAPV